ncbi:hypothetical protein C7G83_07900 [Siccibacter turicensis]|uniref:Uncharacterized protein n=1 Tax=Siccibacter turicensis TaxID=357233 RepID=A0A2P8VKN5_9ENTR|nr:hypothetical protein C7G83_07900 [Siccibacter turicensis]
MPRFSLRFTRRFAKTIRSFEHPETLFYKSVTRMATLFAFLPASSVGWQKQKGFPTPMLLL